MTCVRLRNQIRMEKSELGFLARRMSNPKYSADAFERMLKGVEKHKSDISSFEKVLHNHLLDEHGDDPEGIK